MVQKLLRHFLIELYFAISLFMQWTDARDKLDEQGTVILDALMRSEDTKRGNPDLLGDIPIVERCFAMLQSNYDENYGGFGEKPKFPQPGMKVNCRSLYNSKDGKMFVVDIRDKNVKGKYGCKYVQRHWGQEKSFSRDGHIK